MLTSLGFVPTITLNLPDGDAEAYVVPAAGGAPAPGVLFIVDAIGLSPQIEQMAEPRAEEPSSSGSAACAR